MKRNQQLVKIGRRTFNWRKKESLTTLTTSAAAAAAVGTAV